jgi:SsrA-binding protein
VARRETDKYAAQNRKARHNFLIQDTLEAGMVLAGTEVKMLRQGGASINEAYAAERDGALYLINAHIPEYKPARVNHEPGRARKLLLHHRELDKLLGAIRRDGMTVVPLGIYFNERGIAKCEIGLAKGKKKSDKREAEKTKDWQRDKARLMRDKG